MLKINTPPSCARPPPPREDLTMWNSPLLHNVSGRTQNSKLLQRDQQVSSYAFFQCLKEL